MHDGNFEWSAKATLTPEQVATNNKYYAYRDPLENEVTVLTAENRLVTVSLNLYAQLSDDDRYIPHNWKHVVGVLVNTEEQAQMLVDDLDKARMWALLKR